MVILLITYYTILFNFENNSNPNNEEFPDSSTEETPTNPFNIEIEFLFAAARLHELTVITPSASIPSQFMINTVAPISQTHKDNLLTPVTMSKTKLNSFTNLTTSYLSSSSRTPPIDDREQGAVRLIAQANELIQTLTRNNIENQNVSGDSSSFKITDLMFTEETIAIHSQDITKSTPNNDEIVEVNLDNNNNLILIICSIIILINNVVTIMTSTTTKMMTMTIMMMITMTTTMTSDDEDDNNYSNNNNDDDDDDDDNDDNNDNNNDDNNDDNNNDNDDDDNDNYNNK
ncbi:hypothetical protein Glove_123g116 [Diversispora epigaea]|uniref:Uncharacterized protein n=1 Tax=Diversispora epigaea TaxID=1348612 RepID=A0A397IYX5_9GLOM|nr:hypothetical protein Glove_123g116 [Diversispora epigaea]